MKYLVLFHRDGSIMDKKTKTFSDTEEDEMKKFVDQKVMSGMTCHIYEHRDTYKLNKTVETVNN